MGNRWMTERLTTSAVGAVAKMLKKQKGQKKKLYSKFRGS